MSEALTATELGPLHLPSLRLSFRLEPGEALQLQGPSGSGKSSVLRVLARLDRGRGRLSMGLKGSVPQWRTKVQYLASSPLGAGFSVKDWLHRPSRFAAAKERFRPSLAPKLKAQLSMEQIEPDAPIERCSAGEQQRLRLIRCLMFQPSVLLADEPTSHLDPGLTEVVQSILSDFCGKGGILVMVSHKRQPYRSLDLLGTDES